MKAPPAVALGGAGRPGRRAPAAAPRRRKARPGQALPRWRLPPATTGSRFPGAAFRQPRSGRRAPAAACQMTRSGSRVPGSGWYAPRAPAPRRHPFSGGRPAPVRPRWPRPRGPWRGRGG
ncbi:hypothetical protein E4099_05145 [Streptomyces palmae]|uniref:Uncharacterized protein n=1 Tax=Streptomyces palmae TaxID=1701085 RepID=A0A4Z0HDC1_9ACTN|nr:hypothetical protein E4099_05145 [Streptomyces palmae]